MKRREKAKKNELDQLIQSCQITREDLTDKIIVMQKAC